MFDQTVPAQVIPFREFPDGVFLMRKQSTKIPVIHRTSEMRADWAETTGAWEVVEQVAADQTQSAVARASEEFAQPNYYLLTNNSEHTARYITSGEKVSTQVGQYLAIGLLGVAAICLLNQNGD